MTADLVVLTRPGRLGDLARAPRPPKRWVYACTCGPNEVHRAILMALQAADRGSGPLRVGRILHRAFPPIDATAHLQLLRRDLENGVVLGLDPTDADEALASLAGDPTRWLVVAAARTITAQASHLVGWS